MTERVCVRCGSPSNSSIKRLDITSVGNDDENIAERVSCPYYSKSEVTPEAFEANHNMDDCFKDKYNCCYCSHRIVEIEGGNYCPYEYHDAESREMYYLRPRVAPEKGSEYTARKLSMTYWECPVCKTLMEVSRQER